MNSAEHSQTSPQPEAPRRSRWPKIVGFISAGFVLLILAAILIPCLLSSALAANEASAVGSLRTIANAQDHFSEQHPDKGFASSLAELRPSVVDGQIDKALTSGTKNGYIFTLTPGPRDSSGRITKYTVTATPQTFNKAGTRSFFLDETGVVRWTNENRASSASDPALQ